MIKKKRVRTKSAGIVLAQLLRDIVDLGWPHKAIAERLRDGVK